MANACGEPLSPNRLPSKRNGLVRAPTMALRIACPTIEPTDTLRDCVSTAACSSSSMSPDSPLIRPSATGNGTPVARWMKSIPVCSTPTRFKSTFAVACSNGGSGLLRATSESWPDVCFVAEDADDEGIQRLQKQVIDPAVRLQTARRDASGELRRADRVLAAVHVEMIDGQLRKDHPICLPV